MASIYHDNVELYDIAFTWDTSHEVDWLLKRLGSECSLVLEPGCGSGRMLEAFAQRGVDIVGLDSSKEGVALAKKRIATLPHASAILADMTNFSLGRIFGGAICPINTLAILTPSELSQHLVCMSLHLGTNARYMVQLAIRNSGEELMENTIEWEASRDDTNLRIKVSVEQVDYENMRELHRFTINIISGKRAGESMEDDHWMSIWTGDAWNKLLSKSNFIQKAQYDGDDANYPSVAIGSSGNLMWHELMAKGQ